MNKLFKDLAWKLWKRSDKWEWLLEVVWNNNWYQNILVYKAQGKIKRDVRNLVFTKSYLLQPVYEDLMNDRLVYGNDECASEVLKLVHKNIKYKSDEEEWGLAEYWQDSETTWQLKSGDCEDGALLIASLLRMAGVPAYRVKVCAGWVKVGKGKGGHAYCIYLSEKTNEWYILDWCFYYNESLKNFNKIPHKKCERYEDVWWTFNDKHSWTDVEQSVEGWWEYVKKQLRGKIHK